MKIEFGCGDKNAKDGFVGSDIRPGENIKYACNCWEIDEHVPENSVEEIYSRHMIAQLTFAQGRSTLQCWNRILKDGGKVQLITNDLHFHVKNYLDKFNKRTKQGRPWFGRFEHSVAAIFGLQRGGDWDVQKSGYDIISLRELIEDCGYKSFTQNRAQYKWDLDVSFEK